MTAEERRRAKHQHFDPGDGKDHPNEATCGRCGRSWCFTCDPAPAALCHWCHGRGQSTAPIRLRR